MSAPVQCKVTFQPSGRAVQVAAGSSLLEAAWAAGVAVEAPCGGHGTCGKCRVRVVRGEVAPLQGEGDAVEPDGWCKACRVAVCTDVVVDVPPASGASGKPPRLTGTDGAEPFELLPAVTHQVLQLTPPCREDDVADTVRLSRGCGVDLVFNAALLRELPARLRSVGWHVAVAREGARVLDVGDPAALDRTLGVAFDLGTTSVVGTLFDLRDGSELAVHSELNRQIAFGDDVLARLERIRHAPEGLGPLQEAAVATLNSICDELLRQVGLTGDAIVDATLAGNTAMQQILCGLDCHALGELPFTPTFREPPRLLAAELGLRVHRRARLSVFPQIGGFVGGDTVAGILTAGLDRVRAPTLLIDIGTNGEIVLALPDGTLLCASTAAGPAFEGARIGQGMRATDGAIETVSLREGKVRLAVLGGGEPIGLCGTALIDAAAELLRQGLLESSGRLPPPDELPDSVAPPLRGHCRVDEEGSTRFVLCEHAGHRPVALTQRDLRELQLASGAIRAGAEVLLARAGLSADALEAVLLAGAFGNYVRRENALRIGLLPQVELERVRFIGNAASHGARMALLSTRARDRAAEIARSARHIDLGSDPDFQSAFAEAMLFPEDGP